MSTDQITILCSRGPRLAKLVNADGEITPYDRARTFDLFERPVDDLAGLGAWLRWLSDQPGCCVVRGAILDPARTRGVRRLLSRDPKTGGGPTLCDVARWWLALDVDSLPRPEHVKATDLPACAAVAIERLPPAFHGASCIVQATASHGLKPGVRLRVWFWLDRPTTGVKLKTWLRAAPIDMSVFGAAQPIYTAAPLFAPGLSDHLPTRMVKVPGHPVVHVPPPGDLTPPRQSPTARAPSAAYGSGRRGAFTALSRAVVRVSTAVEGERHNALVGAACGLARFVSGGCLSAEDVCTALSNAAEQVGIPSEETQSVIAWALAHVSAPALGSIGQ